MTLSLTLNSADVPQLCSDTSTKSVPPAPRGQGDIGGVVHSSQIQAQTCVSNLSCPIGFSHHDDPYVSIRTNCDQDFVVGARFGDGGSKTNSAVVGVGGKRMETKHASVCEKGDGGAWQRGGTGDEYDEEDGGKRLSKWENVVDLEDGMGSSKDKGKGNHGMSRLGGFEMCMQSVLKCTKSQVFHDIAVSLS